MALLTKYKTSVESMFIALAIMIQNFVEGMESKMRSNKFEYRIVTAPEGKFRVQYKSLKYPEQGFSNSFGVHDTAALAKMDLERQIAVDDFPAEIVEI